MATNNKLKAYVRYDGTGRVISGSLILQKNKPKVGNWQEIKAYECCNYMPTTTTTTTTEPTTSTTTSTTSTSTSTSTSTTTTTVAPLGINVVNVVNICNIMTPGSVTLEATGGVPTYEYAIDFGMGVQWQTDPVLSVSISGTHSVYVRDSVGTEVSTTVTVQEAPLITATADGFGPTTPCSTDGQATINATGGTPPYQYSFDDGATYSSNNVISNLTSNTFYYFKVKDACLNETANDYFFLNAPTTDALVCSVVSKTPASSSTASDGSITFGATGGTAPYEYSIDGGTTYQSSPTFNNQPANPLGSYTIKDACGFTCNGSYSISSSVNIQIDTVFSNLSVNCNGDTNGSVALTATGGSFSYDFSIDGGTTWQPLSGSFSMLGAGTYTAVVRDANNTSDTDSLTFEITQPDVLDFVALTKKPSAGSSDGEITFNVTGGTPGYTYTIIEIGSQSSPNNIFTGIGAGTYTLSVMDSRLCTSVTKTLVVTEKQPLNLTLLPLNSSEDSLCADSCTGKITATGVEGVSPYEYRINGGAWQSSNEFLNLCIGNYTVSVKDSEGTIVSKDATVPGASYVIFPSSTYVTENECLQFNINTSGVPAGSVLDVSYVAVSPGFDPATDLTAPIVTQITINGSNTESVCIKGDGLLEGDEKFKIIISRCGVEKANSGEITINDTSTSLSYNTIVGQNSLGELGINTAADLAGHLGINSSDISFFEIDPASFDIRARVDVNYTLDGELSPGRGFFGSAGQDHAKLTKFIDIEGKAIDYALGINDGGSSSANFFGYNFQLTTLYFPKIENWTGCGISPNLTSITIPKAKIIGSNAFNFCESLTSIDIPVATTILEGAFRNCTGLTSINLPLATTVGNSAFEGCVQLTSISLPLVTSLGSTTGNNNVFLNITGKTITLNIATATVSDGDVVYLQSNNTVTINP